MTNELLIETQNELRRIAKRINKKHKGLIIAGAVVGSFARGKYYGKEGTDLDILFVVKDPFKAKEVLEKCAPKFSGLQKSFSSFDMFVDTLENIEKIRDEIAQNNLRNVLSSGLAIGDTLETAKKNFKVLRGFGIYWRMLTEMKPFFNKEFFEIDKKLVKSRKALVELEKELLSMKKEFREECENILRDINAVEKEYPGLAEDAYLSPELLRLQIEEFLRNPLKWMRYGTIEGIQAKRNQILESIKKSWAVQKDWIITRKKRSF